MSKIYIKYMKDEILESIKKNIHAVHKLMLDNPGSNYWLYEHFSKSPFIEKKYQIDDFDLLSNPNYKAVDFDNSVSLFEHLKHLPRYVLTDERFWAWLNFEKFYSVALQAMPMNPKKVSSLKDHYIFSNGDRRSLFFGVLSRCYFRVERTIDERLDDHYNLTRFVIENPERFRNLSWRALSNQKHLVLGVLKAEKKIHDELDGNIKNSLYPKLAKNISKLGSVRLIDSIDEDTMFNFAYENLNQLIREDNMNETIS